MKTGVAIQTSNYDRDNVFLWRSNLAEYGRKVEKKRVST